MPKSDSPNVIVGLLSIHSVITRSLRVGVERSEAFARQGFPNSALREGFVNYVRCLLSVLTVHHEAEDSLGFPYFRDRVDAPYDLLTEQHRLIHALLEEAKPDVERAAAEPNAAAPLMSLNSLLRRIEESWHPHIGIEEEHFTVDRFASLLPPEEHRRLSALFMEHTKQHAGPGYLMVPFLLRNLTPEKRSVFASEMPPFVTKILVPFVWKKKWAPMQPFLLA